MTHALPLLLALTCASDPTAALPDAEAVKVIDFVRLTPDQAVRLEGQRVRSHIRARALEKAKTGGVLYQVEASRDRAVRMVLPDAVPDGEMTVEAELHIDYIPPGVLKDGTPSPGWWRYRLEKAAVVGP
jgi:hypothetical protein